MAQLSIVIPTLHEEEGIEKLLTHLEDIKSSKVTSEIIVVDGGSSDETKTVIKKHFCKPKLVEGRKGRARQMNDGAEKAVGEIVYFLHADTFPPKGFDELIINSISPKTQAGSFQMKFDKDSLFYAFWSWFTRFKWNIASGGDQSLFIKKTLFKKLGGFDEEWEIMEDIEIISRIKQSTNYIKLPSKVVTSTRKYYKIGAIRLQTIFGIMHIKKIVGVSPKKILIYYQENTKA